MIDRRNFLMMTSAASLAAMAANGLAAKPKKPNVLFVFTDDQRFDTIAALGNPHIITPGLDRLAKRSFVFRNAYCLGGNSGAVCIPARNMTMSGDAWFRFRYNTKKKAVGEANTSHCDPSKPTFPKSMSAAGYETYYSEKSGTANMPQIQTQFDRIENVHMVTALSTGRPAREVVDNAISFMRDERDGKRPFFMYLGLPCPHDPRWSTKAFRALYDAEKIPLPPNYQPLATYEIGQMVRDEYLETFPRTKAAIHSQLKDYYALITSMDHDIGRLLDALDELKLSGETIVVFSSDQGIAMGSHGMMGKQSIYDDVMRVPLLFAGPGIKRGESDALAYIHDIYPTVCDLVGAKAPKGIDGKSLAPVIGGKSEKVRDTVLLAYRDHQRSVRDGRYKLIRFPKIDRTRLYDLEKDPRETNDLVGDPEHKPLIKRMMAMLADEQKRYGDTAPLSVDKPSKAEFVPPDPPRKKYKGGDAPDEGRTETVMYGPKK